MEGTCGIDYRTKKESEWGQMVEIDVVEGLAERVTREKFGSNAEDALRKEGPSQVRVRIILAS